MTNSANLFRALLGSAGVGKTFYVNNKLKEDSSYYFRAATTGAAAINMSAVIGGNTASTINSALGYYNSANLLYKYVNGSINNNLYLIAKNYKNIVIDEISMMGADQLSLIYKSIVRFNQYRTDNGYSPLGLLVVGDSAQLPAVEGKPFFDSKHWNEFQVTYLTEVKRQQDKEFIAALQAVRVGKPLEAVDYFAENIGFEKRVDYDFKGSTFFGKNVEVDQFNLQRLHSLPGKSRKYPIRVEGKSSPVWNNVPAVVELKEGCLVQLLVNNLKEGYANGDLAIVKDMYLSTIQVELLRNKNIKYIPYCALNNTPIGSNKPIGTVHRLPVRLAYALTSHKCLTGDNLIKTDKGSIFLKDLKVGDKVKDPKNLERTNTVIAKVSTGLKEKYIIKTIYGFVLKGSLDHPILTLSENNTEVFKCIKDIKIGDYVASYIPDIQENILWALVTDKENTGILEEMYDIEVTGNHLFIASSFVNHNCQGLTLDAAQVCLGSDFIKRTSGMLYTMLSRVRTPEGLRIVGDKDLFISSCYVDPHYLPWIK